MTSPANQPFTAIVLQPLSDQNGRVVVPTQARVRGHVQSVFGASGVPRLRLQFDGIDSVVGDTPLQVRVVASSRQIYGGPVFPTDTRYLYGYGTFDRSRVVPYGGGPVVGTRFPLGGYSTFDYSVYLPREVRLDAGATMDLVLTRPLLGPAARVLPR